MKAARTLGASATRMARSARAATATATATGTTSEMTAWNTASAATRTRTPLQRRFSGTAAQRSGASNPAMAFPCLDAIESRSAQLQQNQRSPLPGAEAAAAAASAAATASHAYAARSRASGPEPSYTVGATERFHSASPLQLDWGGVLPEFSIAYETWGTLNADRSNAILLHTGLSASSHARSTAANPAPGWWEKFIGSGAANPDVALDTDKYFVICTNVVGGCYGSTGPGSIDPADGQHYATRFPIVTLEDMVRAQFRLLDGLGIGRLHASVGSSLGGMLALAAGVLFPDRVGRIVSISGCARSHPYSIAMRHTQRQVLMMDPHWNRGFYYATGVPPHAGMKLAREIATVTYRSGPEWEQRFGRRRADPSKPPALCPDYLIETYLDHAGEKFCLTYDPNSLLYVSKAMDLFDLGHRSQQAAAQRRAARAAEHAAAVAPAPPSASSASLPLSATACTLTLPDQPYEETAAEEEEDAVAAETTTTTTTMTTMTASTAATAAAPGTPPDDLVRGLAGLRDHPTLVMGVASDILFPAWQQREIAAALERGGNRAVRHVELGEEQSLFGHDTFLLDLENIGGNVRAFLA